jgi:hypothetical protein
MVDTEEKIKKIKNKILDKLLISKLCFELASSSDSWTKDNLPQHNQSKSHLDNYWLFLVVHRSSILELASIIESRENYKQSANLKNLCRLEQKLRPSVDEFYTKYENEIAQIMNIRDSYIGHSDLNPKLSDQIDSHKTTRVLIAEIADILEYKDIDSKVKIYLSDEKFSQFANLVISLQTKTSN